MEADILEIADLVKGGLDERIRHRGPVPVQQVLVEGSGVDPDANRDPRRAGLPGDQLDVLLFADVPRIEAQPGNPGLDRSQRQPVLEVDVGDDRDR